MNDKINEYLDILTNSGPGEEIRDALVRALIIMDAEHIKDENVADKLIPAALSPKTLEGLETDCNDMVRTDWRRVTERLYDNTGLKVENKNAFRNLSSVLSRYKFVKTLIDILPKGYKESLPVTYDYDAYGAYDIKKTIEFFAQPYTTVQLFHTNDILDNRLPGYVEIDGKVLKLENRNLMSIYIGDATEVRVKVVTPIRHYSSPVIWFGSGIDIMPWSGEGLMKEWPSLAVDEYTTNIDVNATGMVYYFGGPHLNGFTHEFVASEHNLNALNMRYLLIGQLAKNETSVYDSDDLDTYGPGCIGSATFEVVITHSRLLSR